MDKKILIADDDAGICHSLAMLFRGEGYCVDETVDSREAATLVSAGNYDVCLFDYKMTPLTGLDLLKLAKDANPHCAVFIISGMLNIDELCSTGTSAGVADGVISKPFDVEALLQRIAAIVK